MTCNFRHPIGLRHPVTENTIIKGIRLQLQHTAAHCITRQHAAAHCNSSTLQPTFNALVSAQYQDTCNTYAIRPTIRIIKKRLVQQQQQQYLQNIITFVSVCMWRSITRTYACIQEFLHTCIRAGESYITFLFVILRVRSWLFYSLCCPVCLTKKEPHTKIFCKSDFII